MKYLLILFAFLICSTTYSYAQYRLRTPEGKVVLLFENGTWKYEEAKKEAQVLVEIKENEVNKTINLIDSELESQTVIKGVSKKLSKFSETNNVVKSDFQLVSKDGVLLLKTNWKIMDDEAFRFFGYITKKSKMIFSLSNGETIELQYESNFAPKEYPNYKFSTFVAELELNEEQIKRLQKGYLEKIEMIWSRRTESYDIFNPDYFIRELPKLLK